MVHVCGTVALVRRSDPPSGAFLPLLVWFGFSLVLVMIGPDQTPARAAGAVLQHVATKTALAASATSTYPNGVIRDDYSIRLGAPPLFYEPETGTCAANSRIDDGGSCINTTASDGNSWYAVFPTAGVDVREFGADPAGKSDSAPALRAMFAFGSNHVFVIPPGTYLIGSTISSPYALVTGAIGFGLFCKSDNPCRNISVFAYGARFITASATANIDYSGFAWINNFHWYGGSFVANPSNWPLNAEPTAMLLFDINDFRFQDIYAEGNWGGSTRTPVMFAMDNIAYGVFDHIVMPQQSECFDAAFLRYVAFSRIQAVGSGDRGGSSHAACISIEYDATTLAKYPSLVPFTSTDHVTIDDSSEISNFDDGIFLRAGSDYKIAAHSFNNPGGGTWPVHGAGVALYNDTSTCCVSQFDPVHDVSIVGANLSGNGTGGGAGVNITASARAGSEQIYNVLISDNKFNNNNNAAVISMGPYIAAGTVTIGTNMLAGANQTTAYDFTTLKLQSGKK